MDLVLLAERSRKISILSTGHLQVKQYGHSLRRRANARNFNSSRWSIYILNLVDKTKLAYYTSPPTQYNSFVKNLAAFTAFKLVENKFCFIFVYQSIYLSICCLDSFKIVFYSMIPSLDDVKFCRKRQRFEKKLVQLLKIMVWTRQETFLTPFVEWLITICDMQMIFLKFLILFSYSRISYCISKGQKIQSLEKCKILIRYLNHIWARRL